MSAARPPGGVPLPADGHGGTILPAVRSTIFFLWMLVTVIPIAVFALAMSVFVRGDRLYWVCVSFLRLAIWGARVFCGVRYRVHGLERLPSRESGSAVILCPKHQST